MLTIKRISPDTVPEAKALYDRAFPKNERVPFMEMVKSRSRKSEVFTIFDQNEFIGLICMINNMDITHITYLAVEEGQRDKGYGSQILSLVHDEKKGRRIILDIETPEEKSANEEQRLKRKNFYLRNGYEETGVTYSWQGEDYEILSYGGKITKDEFWNFWRTLMKGRRYTH